MILFVLILILFLVIIGKLWQRRYQRNQRQLLIRHLRRWVGTNEEIDPQLQRWINGLSVNEVEVLFDLLDGYCASLNWELTWLFAPQLEKSPVLKRAIEEGVITYACSILASLQLQEDMHAHKAYLAMSKKPTARKQFTLVQKLYARLQERGLIEATNHKRKWLQRQPSRKQKIAAVTQVFDKDPALAMETLKGLLVNEAVADIERDTMGRTLTLSTTAVGA